MSFATKIIHGIVRRSVVPASVDDPLNDCTWLAEEFLDQRASVSLDTDGSVADSSGEGASPPAPLVLAAGSEPVPGYRLDSWLGRGGSGEVWKAIGPGGFPLAMKFIRLGGKDDTVQLRSLELMKEVRHAHLLTLFGAWNRGGLLILGMELADRTLLDRYNEADRQGPRGIPFPELIESIRQAAVGIDFFNEPRHNWLGRQGVSIQHRDIKPQNLFLVGGCVKVGDFGLAKTLDDAHTMHTGGLTLAYAAPELFHGLVSDRSDQYSLAVTYCHLRTGELPFKGPPAALTSGHLFRPPDLTALPHCERPIVARALDKRPESRWPDCVTFVNELVGSHGVKARHGAGLSMFTRRSTDPTRSPLRAALGTRLARLSVCGAGSLAVMGIALTLGSLDRGPISKPNHAARANGPSVDAAPRKDVAPPAISRGGESRPGLIEPTNDMVIADQFDGAPTPERKDSIIPGTTPPLTAFPPEPGPAGQGRSGPGEVDLPDSQPKGVEERGMIAQEVDHVEGVKSESDQGSSRTTGEVPGRGKERDVPEMDTAPGSDLGIGPSDPPRPKAATIVVLMPSANSELVVRGKVGKGDPDEWYGPRRVIHTPPLAEKKDYLVGAFWRDEAGTPMTRKNELGVEPGRAYEVDLRHARPTWRKLPRNR